MVVLAVATRKMSQQKPLLKKENSLNEERKNFKKRCVTERKTSRNEVKLKEMLSWKNPRLNEIGENLELLL